MSIEKPNYENNYQKHKEAAEALDSANSAEKLDLAQKHYDEVIEKAQEAGDIMIHPNIFDDASEIYQSWAKEQIAQALEEQNIEKAKELINGLEKHIISIENKETPTEKLVIKRETIDSDGQEQSYEYNYDERGDLIKELENDVSTKYKYEYDDKGNLTEKSWSGPYYGGSDKYKYNEKGHLTKKFERHHNPKEESDISTQYEYDDKGNIGKKHRHVRLTRNGRKWQETEISTQYEYDDKGNLTKKSWKKRTDNSNTWGFHKEGERPKSYGETPLTPFLSTDEGYTEYEHDDKGNLVKETANSEQQEEPYLTEYKYDNEGNLMKKILIHSIWTTKYEYDKNGNLLKEHVSKELHPGIYEQFYEYEYDDKGNLVKEVQRNSAGFYSFKKHKLTYQKK